MINAHRFFYNFYNGTGKVDILFSLYGHSLFRVSEGWRVKEFEDGAGWAGGREVEGLGRHNVSMVVSRELGLGLIMWLILMVVSIGGRDVDLGWGVTMVDGHGHRLPLKGLEMSYFCRGLGQRESSWGSGSASERDWTLGTTTWANWRQGPT